MAEKKLNIGDSKTKKTYNKALSEEQFSPLVGKKIGETFTGEVIDLPGYEFEICGGSDAAGFPMRKDVQGTSRKRVLIVKGVGLKKQSYKGKRVRKTVAGNTVHEQTAQINTKVVKWGKQPIEAPPAEEEKPAEGAEEKKE